MISDTVERGAYEPPALRVLGSVQALTQGFCDKKLGGSDGYTFMGMAISCSSA